MNLELNDAVKNEVSPASKYFIKQNGKRLTIKLPTFHSKGLQFRCHGTLKSVLVPLHDDTIATLSSVENFVKSRMPDEKYKPLWLGNAMLVNVSRWCAYELISFDGSPQPLPEDVMFGDGMYNIEVHVSHLYCGPHKNGDTCSLSLFVSKISYEPDSNLTDVLDNAV